MFRLFYLSLSSFLLCIAVENQPIAYNWTASIGSDIDNYDFSFVKLIDGDLAAVYFQRINETKKTEPHIKIFTKSGELRKTCKPTSAIELSSDWTADYRVTAFGKSNVVISTPKLSAGNRDAYILLHAVNITDCSSYNTKIKVLEKPAQHYHLTISVTPNDNDTYNVFVRAPLLCDTGICIMTFGAPGNPKDMQLKANTFVDNRNKGDWKIMTVNPFDSSEGYYYITDDPDRKSVTKIIKLSKNGTYLNGTDTLLKMKGVSRSFSNAYGYFSFCSNEKEKIGCILFDSSLVRKFKVSSENGDSRNYMTDVSNTKDGGLMLYTHECSHFGLSGNFCQVEKITVKKLKDGFSDALEIFHRDKKDLNTVFHKAFPQSFVDENEDIYCNYQMASKIERAAESYSRGMSIVANCIKNM